MKEKELHPNTLAYLYNELNAEDRRAYEAEMEKSWELRAETHELKKVLEEVREHEQLSPPPAFPETRMQRILHAARAQQFTIEKKPFFAWFLKPAFAYALTLCFAGTLAYYVTKERPVVERRQTLSLSLAQQEPIAEVHPALVERKEIQLKKSRVDAAPRMEVASALSADQAGMSQGGAIAVQNVAIGGASAPRPAPRSSMAKALLEQQLADSLSVSDQLAMAQQSFNQKDWNEALQHYGKAANLAPGTFEAMFALHQSAKVYEAAGNHTMALDLYDHLLTHYPNYRHRDQALFESGKLYLAENKEDKARENFQTCYDFYPHMRAALAPYLH